MKLGINIGYWGLGLTADEQLALVQEAERLGYDSVWTAEAYGSDAATILGWLAGQTDDDQARLGDLPDARPLAGDDGDDRGHAGPALRRAGCCLGHRLERAAGGRGLARPALRPASCSGRASTSRSCAWRWRASGVEYSGETLELPLPDGPGKALKLTIAPVQERIPIYLAAIGPEEHRRWPPRSPTAGCRCCSRPSTSASSARCSTRASRARATARATRLRDRADACRCSITDDLDAARDAMRPYLALYVGGMGSRDQNFYNQLVASLRVRGRGARGPGPVPGGQARRRRWRRCPTS